MPRHKAREVKCKFNLRQIALAVRDYAGTFGGTGLTNATTQPTDVIAYDPPANHADGYIIVFADDRVAVVDPVNGAKLIAAAEAAMKARVRSATTSP